MSYMEFFRMVEGKLLLLTELYNEETLKEGLQCLDESIRVGLVVIFSKNGEQLSEINPKVLKRLILNEMREFCLNFPSNEIEFAVLLFVEYILGRFFKNAFSFGCFRLLLLLLTLLTHLDLGFFKELPDNGE